MYSGSDAGMDGRTTLGMAITKHYFGKISENTRIRCQTIPQYGMTLLSTVFMSLWVNLITNQPQVRETRKLKQQLWLYQLVQNDHKHGDTNFSLIWQNYM